jgi:hypothetical protein
MKKVNVSNVAPGAAMKFKNGTFDHINSAIVETGKYLAIKSIGESYSNAGTCYVLWGCVNSGSGLNYIISEGAVFLGGEIFHVPAQSITVAGGQTPQITQSSTFTTGTNADPVSFTDASTHNIHEDRICTFTAVTTSGSYLEFPQLIRVNYSKALTLTANYSTGFSSTPTLIRNGSVVQGKGIIACGASAATTQVISTLDVEFRPTVNRMFPCVITDNGGNFKYANVILLTNGQLSINNVFSVTSINGYYLSLDNLSYYI